MKPNKVYLLKELDLDTRVYHSFLRRHYPSFWPSKSMAFDVSLSPDEGLYRIRVNYSKTDTTLSELEKYLTKKYGKPSKKLAWYINVNTLVTIDDRHEKLIFVVYENLVLSGRAHSTLKQRVFQNKMYQNMDKLRSLVVSHILSEIGKHKDHETYFYGIDKLREHNLNELPLKNPVTQKIWEASVPNSHQGVVDVNLVSKFHAVTLKSKCNPGHLVLNILVDSQGYFSNFEILACDSTGKYILKTDKYPLRILGYSINFDHGL